MDRNTLIGLGLIGVIMVTFTMLNQPSAEELKKERAKAAKEAKKAQKEDKAEAAKTVVLNQKGDSKAKTTNQTSGTENKGAEAKAEEWFSLESDKLKIEVSTKGGIISSAWLKEFESYRNFVSKSKKQVPLKMFGRQDAQNVLEFELDGKKMSTSGKDFEVLKQTKNKLVLSWSPAEGKSITYTYRLNPETYDLDFQMSQKGFDEKAFRLKWVADLYKTERLLSEQRRVSTVCFKYKGEDYDWLSEMANDAEKMEKNVEWIAYKQSYFSTIMKPEKGFNARNGKLSVTNFKEGHKKYFSHIKKYYADLSMTIPEGNNASVSWFFGPNDYEVLKSYDSGYEDIINYGWGLFRWINIYVIQPTFNWLASTGLGFGIVILLLTLIIKIFLTPIQWKMYLSSAKMRILKPEVEAINAKYTKQEDAMKKQMETMALYRESGASPLSGCVPMLIQMPILLAVFRFFPAAFELRQKPFLWAEDLSSYDSVWDFGMYIWPYGDHMSLFTLLMSVTTLVYTWLNSGNMQQPSQPGMPNMKVLMYIFPVMMIFFFNNYSSGLSYYYFISTLISILIMVAIKQFFVDEEKLKAKMAAKKANAAGNGTKKKSKFQERLEQMQKAQMDRMKNQKK